MGITFSRYQLDTLDTSDTMKTLITLSVLALALSAKADMLAFSLCDGFSDTTYVDPWSLSISNPLNVVSNGQVDIHFDCTLKQAIAAGTTGEVTLTKDGVDLPCVPVSSKTLSYRYQDWHSSSQDM